MNTLTQDWDLRTELILDVKKAAWEADADGAEMTETARRIGRGKELAQLTPLELRKVAEHFRASETRRRNLLPGQETLPLAERSPA